VNEARVFICGKKPDHQCDADGPVLCGGENPDGTYWSGPDTEENKRRASWGSVTCSKCGEDAMSRSMWDGP
jgi:hypothetical protein